MTRRLGEPLQTEQSTDSGLQRHFFPSTISSYLNRIGGRSVTSKMQITVPASWNVTTALPTYQETQTYNDANQLMTTQTTVGAQVGYTFSQAYDSSSGAVTGLSNNGVGVANLATQSFDLHGQVSDVNFQTTTGTALANDHFTYDGDLRPSGTTATWQSGSGSSGTIFSNSRAFDPVGNVISTATTQAAVPGQSTSGGSETQNFCYDDQGRLVWAGNSGTIPAAGNGTCGTAALSNSLNGASYSSSYTYTHLGQQWQGPLNGTGTQQQYLYCSTAHSHQVTGLYPIGTTCANAIGSTYSVGYDNWGNVTTRSYNSTGAQLSYDVLDKLVQWNAGSTSQEWYAYASGSSRVLKRSTTTNGTSLTVYAFGIEEHVYSASGSNTSNTYYYNLDSRLIGKFDGTNTQFFLTDGLGSVLSTFNAVANTAVILGNQEYGPYGNSRYSKGSMGTNKGFTGQYKDITGLDYYNARYYDPVIGRFLSADIIQGNMQGMDPYTYVGGNPETHNDPTGNRIDFGEGETATVNTVTHTVSFFTPSSNGNKPTIDNYSYWQLFHPASSWLSRPEWKAPPQFHTTMFHKNGENLVSGIVDWFVKGYNRFVNPPPYHPFQTCVLSFTPETKVATLQGSSSIQSLHRGDSVWAYNPQTHKKEIKPIVHVWINHDDDLVDLIITSTKPAHDGKPEQQVSEVIHTNQKHPFLTQEKGFIPVRQLHIGMHVVNADGEMGTITGWKVVPGAMTMYNLEVDQDHTFTVGTGQWVVHNCTYGNDPLYETLGSVVTKDPDGGYADISDYVGDFDPSLLHSDTTIPEIQAQMSKVGARQVPFNPGQYFEWGMKWEWTDPNGYKSQLEIHSASTNPTAGSNASTGSIARYRKWGGNFGRRYYDRSNGRWISESRLNPGSGMYNQGAAESTHMPMEPDVEPGLNPGEILVDGVIVP